MLPPLRFLLLLGLVLFLVFKPAHATVYYVDASQGNDDNPGTGLAVAFLTIQKCASVAIAGDTCSIRGGTYRETVKPANSGTACQPITFTAYAANETVIVSGANVVPGPWTLYGNNIYSTTSMTWDVYSLSGAQVRLSFLSCLSVFYFIFLFSF